MTVLTAEHLTVVGPAVRRSAVRAGISRTEKKQLEVQATAAVFSMASVGVCQYGTRCCRPAASAREIFCSDHRE